MFLYREILKGGELVMVKENEKIISELFEELTEEELLYVDASCGGLCACFATTNWP